MNFFWNGERWRAYRHAGIILAYNLTAGLEYYGGEMWDNRWINDQITL